jgi:hypothetical protein
MDISEYYVSRTSSSRDVAHNAQETQDYCYCYYYYYFYYYFLSC